MRLCRWSRNYLVCIPQIDAEHRALFRLMDNLRDSLIGRAHSARVQPALHDVTGHATEHFSNEERLMRTCGYPLYQWHRSRHLAARPRLNRLARCIRRERHDLALAYLDELAGFLANHIRLADRMLGAYLRNYQRAQSARVNGTPTVARAAQLDGC